MILVFYLKVLRRNIRVKEKRKIKYTTIVEQLLISFLYSEEEGVYLSERQNQIIQKFKRGFFSKFKRKIITSSFIKLSHEISGNMIVIMHKLYEEIGMTKFAYKKLRSKKWNIVAIGIRDIREFKIVKAKNKISKFINHSREEVRREAHLYFIELFGFEGLTFLDDLKVPLSEWDQIQLLGKIQNFEDHEILDITKWLKSENDYVVIFMFSIAKIFNKFDTKDLILNALNHRNLEVRLKAIDVLTHFEIKETKGILKNKIEQLSIKEKIAFFVFLEKTASEEDRLFLIDHINHENFDIKYKALKILNTIDNSLFNKLEKTSEDESYNKIIKFLDYSYGV
jgi:hypothetical protein